MFNFTIEKMDEGGLLAHTLPLDVYSQGDTKEEAIINLGEAIHLFLKSCLDRGTLGAVLEECGMHGDEDVVRYWAEELRNYKPGWLKTMGEEEAEYNQDR